MNLFQKQQTTSEYTRIPNASAVDDDETATVLATTIIGHRSKGWMVMVAGIMMLLLVAGAPSGGSR